MNIIFIVLGLILGVFMLWVLFYILLALKSKFNKHPRLYIDQ